MKFTKKGNNPRPNQIGRSVSAPTPDGSQERELSAINENSILSNRNNHVNNNNLPSDNEMTNFVPGDVGGTTPVSRQMSPYPESTWSIIFFKFLFKFSNLLKNLHFRNCYFVLLEIICFFLLFILA